MHVVCGVILSTVSCLSVAFRLLLFRLVDGHLQRVARTVAEAVRTAGVVVRTVAEVVRVMSRTASFLHLSHQYTC